VTDMAKKPHKGRSRVSRAPGRRLDAPDAESAIKEAIRQFHVTDPEQQKRLAARPKGAGESYAFNRRPERLLIHHATENIFGEYGT
jgi:hypothetical protein